MIEMSLYRVFGSQSQLTEVYTLCASELYPSHSGIVLLMGLPNEPYYTFVDSETRILQCPILEPGDSELERYP
jgi:hypothetical protein